MANHLRTSEITIFCAFTLFCMAWLPLSLVSDPLAAWESAAVGHPELLIALLLLGIAMSVAVLAILVGGLPMLFTAFTQSIAARRWRLFTLFVIPALAVAALVAIKSADIPWASVSQAGVVQMQQPLAVQVGLILLPLIAIGGSVAAVALIIGRSEVSLKAFRFALLPAGVVTAALVLGLFGAVAATVLLFAETQQVGGWPALQIGGLLLMLAAVVLAAAALRRGYRAVQVDQ